MEYCVYYDKDYKILDFLPLQINPITKNSINEFWNQEIPRKILIALSETGETTTTILKEKIGHSMSTLHENILKLENGGLIETRITYVENKKKTISPKVLFVTKNPKFKVMFRKFFQGIWIDSKRTEAITHFLQKNKDKYFTADEIATKVKMPIDEVELLLSNWDSTTTRTLSNFLQERPFEKKIIYRGVKK